MPRKLIYFCKRLVHDHTRLYQLLYSLATFNLDYLWQRLNRGQYPSRFGGMWTDRKDYPDLLERKEHRGQVDAVTRGHLTQWREDGFTCLPQAIDAGLIDTYLAQIDELKAASPSPLLVTSISLPEPVPYESEVVDQNYSVRTVDDYFFSPAGREILLNPVIMHFIQEVFEARPVLTQSLLFTRGSQQAIHQDTAFVRMNSPMKMVGVWIALEDIQPGSGELLYYPGSHRWEGFLFSGRFKHYDEERDGPEQLQQWYRWLEDEARQRQLEPRVFLPRKGDVLVWHAALAHGGARITGEQPTRRSLVGHYCPKGVRPLYHYYKPAQRRRYTSGDYHYYSSYYRL